MKKKAILIIVLLLQVYFFANIFYLNREVNEVKKGVKSEKLMFSGLKKIIHGKSSIISFEIDDNGVIEHRNIYILEDTIPYAFRSSHLSAYSLLFESYGYNNNGNIYSEETEINAGIISRKIIIDTTNKNKAKFNLDDVNIEYNMKFWLNIDTSFIQYRNLDVIKLKLENEYSSLKLGAKFNIQEVEEIYREF